ncbi:MAG: c-type cytochrome [Candidatus Omnitrophica bacterium]|nr:c-type cytochrome [Candidatus Omnitrophota bacterium]
MGTLSPLLAAAPSTKASEAPVAQAGPSGPDVSLGKAAFDQYCARCHGLTGKGDGRDAKRLYPRPRDLTSGVFKVRDTASGSAPTDEDLFGTITKGLTAGGMPDWRHLDESVRWQLVAYLKTLSSNFTDNPPQPLSVGPDPGRNRTNPATGKQVYEKLGCASCHGVHGRGNGPSAASLTDNWGMAIRPADLTQGWNYRAGSDPQVIAWRVLTGIDGSPMPSYAEAASPEEIWQVAYYVRSLQQEPRWTMIVRVPYATQALPTTTEDPRWATVERADVRLRNVVNSAGEMTAPLTVAVVSLQALHTDEAISVRLAWHDATQDQGRPADAIAMALRPALNPAHNGHPESEVRPVGVVGDVVTLQTWPLRQSPALDLCVWSADRQQAREAVVKSYEPLLEGTRPAVTLPSQATYSDGEWTLVITRPLTPGVDHGAQLSPRGFVPVAFTVWDGGNAGQRAVSGWVDLALQEPAVVPTKHQPHVVLVWVVSSVVLVIALALVFKNSF